MEKPFNKIFTIIVFALLAMNYNVRAQEIKFPESFRGDASLFKGMKIAKIPQEVQAKYGISENPGLIADASKTKGILMSGQIPNVKSIYFEIYEDLEEKKMDCGFEVAQFASEAELNNILPGLDKKKRDATFLTLENYLIILYCDGYKNFGERIDNMTKYFQEKLEAKLYQDRRKDKREDAEPSDTIAETAAPLPPTPENAGIPIDFNDLERGISNTGGFSYLRNKKRQKFAPGNYNASTFYPAYEKLIFTINQDSLLDGEYHYSYAESFDKSPIKETKMQFDNGIQVSEMVYLNGDFKGSKTYLAAVTKEGKDYLITINTSIKNPANGDTEVKTVFRNRKPISKITTRLGISVVRKDFETNTLDHYNSKGQLTKLQKPELTEEYNSAGAVTYKKVWIGGNQFVYREGKLRHKEIRVKDKDQFLVTEYDASGKILKEWSKGIEIYPAIADPDEYESDMSEAMFEYYKKKAK